jgi:hypothetical protein
MPGIVPLGKLFFRFFLQVQGSQNRSAGKQRPLSLASLSRAPEELIVGKIIRPKLRRRSEHLIALTGNAAMPARSELILVRIRRDDSGAPRGQTINYPSIGRYSKHSDAH